MQVYLVVRDNAIPPNFLVVRKRVQNRLWDGHLAPNSRTVNQAGQWALPGGRQEPAENAADTALREFREETGIDLAARFPGNAPVQAIATADYTVFVMTVTAAELQALQQAVHQNLQPGHAPGLPHSPHVQDWELETAVVVPHNQLAAHLGHRVAIAHPPPGYNQHHYRQAIDWYAAIAGQL